MSTLPTIFLARSRRTLSLLALCAASNLVACADEAASDGAGAETESSEIGDLTALPADPNQLLAAEEAAPLTPAEWWRRLLELLAGRDGGTPVRDAGATDAGTPPVEDDAGEPPVEQDAGTPPVVDSGTPPAPNGTGAIGTPQGFARKVTGGKGGQVVRPNNIAELKKALCGSTSGNNCTDGTPRIIELSAKVFDFTGSEGTAREAGCVVKQCSGGQKSENILNRQNWCGSNGNKPLFNITYDKAGTTPLLVGSNKTLVGVGAGATIKGKGLTLRGGVKNIIIQNITISDINAQTVWGGDALTIDEADGVWFDHNRIALVGRQMLVTGFGKAANVTFSNNDFDGRTPYSATCNGAHYWAFLFLGANDTLTLQGNWIHDISGRAPHAGGMQGATNAIHFVNNLFDKMPGHALEPLTKTARLFLEGNYFRGVTTLIEKSNDPGYVFGPSEPVSAALNQQCQSALGRPCKGNIAEGGGKLPTDQAALNAVSKGGKDALIVPADARSALDAAKNAGPRLTR